MMHNLLVIFGAGASYDYSEFSAPCPLTNELVNSNRMDQNLLLKYKDCGDLFTEIRPNIIQKRISFENALRELKEKFGNQKHRKIQFAALAYYLKDFFKNASGHTSTINNYANLINKLKDHNSGTATIATFNYDSLFETALRTGFNSMRDYISGAIKLIKIHGSHDWSYIQDKRNFLLLSDSDNLISYDIIRENPDVLEKLKEEFEPVHDTEISDFSGFRFPAIAIPLTNKHNFICPLNHTQTLQNAINTVDKILIIGWAARDQNLIRLIKEGIRKNISTLIVAGSKEGALETSRNLNEISQLKCALSDKTFSDSLSDGEIDNFLSN